MNFTRNALLAALTGCTVLSVETSAAEENIQQGAKAPDSEATLEEVVVTAQRRAERMQDIPLSVSAVSAEMLTRTNTQTVEQIGLFVPGFKITQEVPPFGAQTFLRGIGNVVGLESSVSLYTDGIYQPLPLSALLRLNDVARVEVLKGPQGTLFGRSSTGGAIQLITRVPSDQFQAEGSVGYGNYHTFDTSGYVSGPISKSVQGSLAVTYKNQAQGWGHNLLVNNEDIYRDRYAVTRGKLKFDIADDTSLLLGAYYVNAFSATASSTGGGFPDATVGESLAAKPPITYTNPVNFYDGRTFLPPSRDTLGYGADVRIEQGLPFAKLISITAYQWVKETSFYGGVDPDSLAVNSNPRSQALSQELQIQSLPSSVLEWQGGLYYIDFYDNNNTNIFSKSLIGKGTQSVGNTSVESSAAYFQGTYPIFSQTKITAGARFTHDQLVANGKSNTTTVSYHPPQLPQVLSVAQAPDQIGKADFNRGTWRVAVDQKIGDQLLYTSVSTGYKPGFFNNIGGFPGGVTPVLNPETNINYEIGAKTSWLESRLIVNVAAFWNELRNIQVSAYTLNALTGMSTSTVANAASARSRGVDLDASARLTRGLSLNLSAEMLDPRYQTFLNAPATAPLAYLETRPGPGGVPRLYVPGCSAPATGLRPGNGGNTNLCTANASRKQLILAAKFTSTAGLSYEFSVGNGSIVLSGDVAYNSGYYWDAANLFKQPPFAVADGSIRYNFGSFLNLHGASVLFWMRNITDRQYWSSVRFNPGPQGTLTTPAEPRAFGVSLGMSL